MDRRNREAEELAERLRKSAQQAALEDEESIFAKANFRESILEGELPSGFQPRGSDLETRDRSKDGTDLSFEVTPIKNGRTGALEKLGKFFKKTLKYSLSIFSKTGEKKQEAITEEEVHKVLKSDPEKKPEPITKPGIVPKYAERVFGHLGKKFVIAGRVFDKDGSVVPGTVVIRADITEVRDKLQKCLRFEVFKAMKGLTAREPDLKELRGRDVLEISYPDIATAMADLKILEAARLSGISAKARLK